MVFPDWVAPGTTKAWVTPRPAETSRQLVIQGGFLVDSGRVRRLERRARHLGFHDLRSYLQTRCDAGHSVPGLARELGVSEWTITKALATLGVVLPPRPERLALQRRRHAEERVAARVAELGFAEVRAYLEDRLIERERLLAEVAAELGAHRETVRRLMQQVGVTRRRRTARQLAGADGTARPPVMATNWLGRAGRGGAWSQAVQVADAAARRWMSAFAAGSQGHHRGDRAPQGHGGGTSGAGSDPAEGTTRTLSEHPCQGRGMAPWHPEHREDRIPASTWSG